VLTGEAQSIQIDIQSRTDNNMATVSKETALKIEMPMFG
jgi:hypothetical protein